MRDTYAHSLFLGFFILIQQQPRLKDLSSSTLRGHRRSVHRALYSSSKDGLLLLAFFITQEQMMIIVGWVRLFMMHDYLFGKEGF